MVIIPSPPRQPSRLYVCTDVTTAARPAPVALDFAAAREWPARTAADILGVGLLVAILVALPVAPTDLDRHQLPKETAVHLATWLAFILARAWPPRGLRPAAGWALALLLGAAAASALQAQNGWLAFRALALMVTGTIALITARHLAALGYARRLLAWCAVAGVIGAATGLAQAYGATSVFFATTRVPGGTFGNRNFMAHTAALTLPLLLFGAFTGRKRTALLAIAGSAVVAAAIVLSRSRAAWIGAGAGVMVTTTALLLARHRVAIPVARWRVGSIAIMACVGVIAALAIPNRLAWRSQSPYVDTLTGLTAYDAGSGRGRLLQYANTAHLIQRHPVLGVGPGNWSLRYGDVAPLNDPSWVWGDVIPLNPWPSSDWFALVSECGVIAGLAAILLAVALVWRGVAALRTHGERIVAGATLLASLATLLVVGSFDAVLLLPIGLLFVALSTGALLELSDGGSALSPPVRWAASPAVTAAIVALLGLCALRSTLQTTAYVVAGSGRSLRRLSWAARLDPGSYPIRIALAQRLDCRDARTHIIAALRLAPDWPASELAARRCGVPRAR